VPALIYAAEKDRWLPPRFHAAWIAQNMPSAIFHVIPNAWHFAFMDKASFAISTLDGDANADPPGFDRAALLKQLDGEIPDFFDRTLSIETKTKRGGSRTSSSISRRALRGTRHCWRLCARN
jgi:predicted dienelactone hydrolase